MTDIGVLELASVIVAIGGAIGMIYAVFRWLDSKVANAVDEERTARVEAVKAIHEKIEHNRANADQKSFAADALIREHNREIGELRQADTRHAAAIEHLSQQIDQQFSAFNELQKVRFEGLEKMLREVTSRG